MDRGTVGGRYGDDRGTDKGAGMMKGGQQGDDRGTIEGQNSLN